MTMYREENGVAVLCTPEEEAAITAQWASEESTKAANAWHNGRVSEYPKINDQIDIILSQFQALSAVLTLTPQMTQLIAYCQGIKAKYPKPTQ